MRRVFLFVLICLFALPLSAADLSAPETYLGSLIDDLITEFGAPDSVRAVRGGEIWQDDVVFSYDGGIDFYIAANRVWQIRLRTKDAGAARNVRVGDPFDGALEAFGGDPAEVFSNAAIFELFEQSFPIRVQIFYDESAVITDIYAYRADY